MISEKIEKKVSVLFSKLSKVVSPHPGVRNHGTRHWKKVAAVAGELASRAGEPHEVIHAAIAAGLLHDIGRIFDSTKKDPHHGARSVSIAKKENLCKLLEVKKEYWKKIFEAVNDHTHGKKTDQLIAKYLWDADRLCFMGFSYNAMDPKRMSSSVWQELCE
ncbi:MAG: HD domain-containing protein [bacterium]|nr:HD domain-containing protein [bacterium]